MPPLARYQHTMNFYAPSRILVIYGGVNDNRNVGGFPAYYSNLGVLDLTCLVWLSVQVEQNPLDFRCSHSACFYGSKLLIIGGYNRTGLLVN